MNAVRSISVVQRNPERSAFVEVYRGETLVLRLHALAGQPLLWTPGVSGKPLHVRRKKDLRVRRRNALVAVAWGKA